MGNFDGLLPDIAEKGIIEKDRKEEKQIERWVATTAMILGVVLIMLVTLVVLLVYPASRVTAEKVRTNVPEQYNETVHEEQRIRISYEEFLANKSAWADRETTLYGQLRKRVLDRGVTEYSVLDETGQALELRSLGESEKALFPLDAKTRFPYEVSGRFVLDFQVLRFDVDRVLIPSGPVDEFGWPITESYSNVTRERNRTVESIAYRTVRESMLRNLLRTLAPGPVPQSCEDGTALDACAAERPYWCGLDAVLRSRPDTCGCPEGAVARGEECVEGQA